MGSKSFQSFDGKIRSLKQHLQLADVVLTNANKVCSKNAGNGKTIADTLSSSLATHTQLNIPNESIDISRTFATSRKKLNEQAIIELYAIFSDYLSSIIRELENTKPQRILNMVPSDTSTDLSYADIFSLGSYAQILDEIARRVYRALEAERCTPKLLDKFIKATKININTVLKEDALLYLEIRHLIIHNNSRADSKLQKMNNRNLVSINSSNLCIFINYPLSSSAIDKVYQLCSTIDSELIKHRLI